MTVAPPDAPVLVTGAPGNVGTPLVRELLRLGAPVRVAARDVAAARTEFGNTVDVVPFNFADPATFGAFDGAERMFLLRPPAIADIGGVIGPAIRAAARRGVRHVVFLSIQGAERNRIVPHRKIEDRLRASGMAWTFVRAAYFMQNLFRQGAFEGATPKDAYFVKCDGDTTTASDRDRGIVNIWVGFAPLKPAEFVVLYLQQKTAEAS